MKLDPKPSASSIANSGGASIGASGEAVDTRSCVIRSLLVDGPTTAVQLAARLGLTPGAIRRHLDSLVDADQVRASERAPYGPTAPRGRGRPARVYSVTDHGRDSFAQSYDALAISALRYVRAAAGNDGVMNFARSRAVEMEVRYRDHVNAAAPEHKAETLAQLLSDDGFATSVQASGSPSRGEQICQHHCPVAHVAEEFPELCEAEAEMFGRLLGSHVQRLATIAHGDSVCTTHLPAASPGVPVSTLKEEARTLA